MDCDGPHLKIGQCPIRHVRSCVLQVTCRPLHFHGIMDYDLVPTEGIVRSRPEYPFVIEERTPSISRPSDGCGKGALSGSQIKKP